MPWSEEEHDAIVKMLAIVCEVTGTTLSGPAKMLILAKLGTYRAPGVLRALDMASTTCKYRLTLADICEHLSNAPLPPASEVKALPPPSPQLEANKKRLNAVLARISGELTEAERNPVPWNEVAEK